MHTSNSTHRRRPRVIATALVSAVLFTSGCAGGDTGAGSTDASAANAEISLAVQAPPATLDPANLQEGQQSFLWNSVYDTLFYLDNDGKVQPNAAKDYKWSDEGRTLTLTLRDDLTFSDGQAITAKDVAATLERTRTSPGQQKAKLATVATVTAVDDSTVVFTLSTPSPWLITNLAMAAGVIADADTVGTEAAALRPLASGAYVIDEKATVADTTYVLNRREDYWNAKAYPFRKVTLQVIKDSTASFNALMSGQVTAGTLRPEQKKPAEAAGLNIGTVEATSVVNLIILDRKGEVSKPLADVRVRQAINMAFDREKLVKQILGGLGVASPQIFNPRGPAYDESLNASYPFDPQKAKALIAEAGYPNGFTLKIPSSVHSKNFEPVITQPLADIGVTLEWVPVPAQDTVASLASKQFPVAIFITSLSAPHRELGDNLGQTGFLNPFAYSDPKLNELIGQVAVESDEEKAAGLYKQINKFTVENALDSPLFYTGLSVGTKKGIEYLADGSSTQYSIRQFGVSK